MGNPKGENRQNHLYLVDFLTNVITAPNQNSIVDHNIKTIHICRDKIEIIDINLDLGISANFSLDKQNQREYKNINL